MDLADVGLILVRLTLDDACLIRTHQRQQRYPHLPTESDVVEGVVQLGWVEGDTKMGSDVRHLMTGTKRHDRVTGALVDHGSLEM